MQVFEHWDMRKRIENLVEFGLYTNSSLSVLAVVTAFDQDNNQVTSVVLAK